MIKYLLQTQNFTDVNFDNLNKAEENCDDIIRKALLCDDYSDLCVKMNMMIEPKEKDSLDVLFTHNAGFSLENSILLAKELKKSITSSLKTEELLPEGRIHIDLDIKQKETRDKKNTSSDKKADDNSIEFYPTKALYTFDQVILPEETLKDINDALNVIECKELIYNTWGFSEIEPAPKSIINFFGKPGTGKTMCAHAIANRLNRPLLALKYSEIESKYLGDSTKNLKKAFDAARETKAILFFDEADSFLGKRIQNVSQGSDQAINSLRSQMLIQIEEFSGMVIFATNLVGNYDKAFESRIMKHIQFELPNQEARCAIIRKMLPSKLPLEKPFTDEEIDEVSVVADGFSGREIKSTMLDMLLSKASEKNPDVKFTIEDLKEAFLKKKESLKKLKQEENDILKEKIAKKLHEKAEEAKAEQEASKKEDALQTADPESEQSEEKNEDSKGVDVEEKQPEDTKEPK